MHVYSYLGQHRRHDAKYFRVKAAGIVVLFLKDRVNDA